MNLEVERFEGELRALREFAVIVEQEWCGPDDCSCAICVALRTLRQKEYD